jgi:stage II sporulation protein AA (anti-sigma F factor antagonist)
MTVDPAWSTTRTVLRGVDGRDGEVTLSVEIRSGSPETVIALVGELEVSTAAQLRELLDRSPITSSNVVLDLAGLDFIDSTGIGCLFKLHRRVADLGGIVVARHPQPQIHRVMEMTQLNRLIAILDD